jgi:hypothetical protein
MERFAADQAWWREQKEKLEVARHRLDSAAAELTGAQATIKP